MLEFVRALPAAVEGQTTANYQAERLALTAAQVTFLARGVPVSGDLE